MADDTKMKPTMDVAGLTTALLSGLRQNLYRARLTPEKDRKVLRPQDLKNKSELEVVTHLLAQLFPRDPDMVDRFTVQMERYLKGREVAARGSNPVQVEETAERMANLRFYLRNAGWQRKWAGSIDPSEVDLISQWELMRQAGAGLTKDEIVSLNISTRNVALTSPHINKSRFWGKIYGTVKDYYILECDIHQHEIKDRIRKRKVVERLEKQKEGRKQPPTFINLKVPRETIRTMEEKFNTEKPSFYEISELDKNIALLKKGVSRFRRLKLPGRPHVVQVPEKTLPSEDSGSGLNRKIYLVSNNATGDWIELPNVTPAQVVIARRIKKCFTGNLQEKIVSCPYFPGDEKHYLRAQVARISAGSQISPMGFYTFHSEEEAEELEDEELDDRGNCVLNRDYHPMQMSELGGERGIDYWVHHTEYILEEGRAAHWTSPTAIDEEEEELDEDNLSPRRTAYTKKTPKLLTPINWDRAKGPYPAWTLERKEWYLENTTTVVARSNVWPGAAAYAWGRRADHVYLGWGQKEEAAGLTPWEPPPPQEDYPGGPEVAPFEDPSVEETLLWVEENTVVALAPEELSSEQLPLGEGEHFE